MAASTPSTRQKPYSFLVDTYSGEPVRSEADMHRSSWHVLKLMLRQSLLPRWFQRWMGWEIYF